MNDRVTVCIPTSPIPRHPDTSLIEECVDSIQGYYSAFEYDQIIVMVDGVRPQVKHRAKQYEEYKEALHRKSLSKWGRFSFFTAEEHLHQGLMLKRVLELVATPTVLFIEHDAILRHDPAIRWGTIFKALLEERTLNMVRFYNWDHAPWHEHEYLMRGDYVLDGTRFLKTVQFSGWPFISTTEYLKTLLDRHLNGRKVMLETACYIPIASEPWEQNKIAIYAPKWIEDGLEVEKSRMFTHRDGRTDERTGERDPGEW